MSGHGGGDNKGFSLPLLRDLEEVTHAIGSAAGVFLPAPVLISVFVFLIIGFLFLSPTQTALNFEMFFYTSPLWVPLLLARFGVLSFVKAKRLENHVSQKTILLELLLPKDTMKSPAAMEAVFNGLYLGGGESTWWAKYFAGKTRTWLSFEMAAFNGQVHFYVWVAEPFRRGVEQQLYSQYPNIQIIEVEDYSRLRDPSAQTYTTLAVEYEAKRGNPAVPIKTYVDYGVNETTMLSEHTDPLNQVFKFMSGLDPKEEVWLQFVIRTSKSEKYRGQRNSKGKLKTWKDDIQSALDKVQGVGGKLVSTSEIDTISATDARVALRTILDNERRRSLVPSQINAVNLIERNKDKLGFDVGIRLIYSTPADKSADSIQAFVRGIFNAFSSRTENGGGFAHAGTEKFSGYPWEDAKGKRRKREEHEMVEFYRARSFFYPPYRGSWSILTSEELATLYHLPSRTLSVQTTPPNLPV